MLKITNPVFNHLKRNFHLTTVARLTFTPEHDQLRHTVRKIVEKEINPYVEKWEKEGMFDGHAVFKSLGNAGLLGITREPEYGGLGLDYSFTVAFFEELGATVDAAGIISGIGVQTDMALPALVRFGSDKLKREFLAPSLSGDFVACVGVSEPEGGSDVAAVRTTAVKSGDDLIINGGKMWITNGMQADWMCLLANTSKEGGPHRNKSLICVPLNLPGVNRARKIAKMGQSSSDTAQIFFDNVRVPASNIIGDEGLGFMYQMLQFQDERLSIAGPALTGSQRVLNETIEYCKTRKTFGQELIKNQYIYFTFAELQTEIESLKSLYYRAVDLLLEGEDVTYLASMIKLKSGRLMREVSDKCLQFWGGMGYTDDVLVSRMFRDGRLLSIAGGPDEIMLGIIAKYMNILPKPDKKSK